ncbi:MAG: MltA domain-containing protein, partial [Planctomycetota bacterium]
MTQLTQKLALCTALALTAAPGCVVSPAIAPPHIVSLETPEPLVTKADFGEELAPGEMALEKVTDLSQWPSLAVMIEEPALVTDAIDQSLQYLQKPSSQRYYPYLDISHERVRRSLERFQELVTSGQSPATIEAILRRDFELYRSKGRRRTGEVLFTAYCEPIYEAKRTRDSQFKYPLYRRPADLRSDQEGVPLGREAEGGNLVPYYTRQEIDEGGVLANQGLELVFLKNPFEAFLVHVQGSARLKLVDEGGALLPVGYAGKSDRPYRSVGKALIRDGKIRKEDMSLASLKRYFATHTEELLPYLYENESYVFFRVAEGGPFGSIGARVTAGTTIATDKSVFPRAALAFVDA